MGTARLPGRAFTSAATSTEQAEPGTQHGLQGRGPLQVQGSTPSGPRPELGSPAGTHDSYHRAGAERSPTLLREVGSSALPHPQDGSPPAGLGLS